MVTMPEVAAQKLEDGRLVVTFDKNIHTVDEVLAHLRESGSPIQDILIRDADIEQIVRDIYQEGEPVE